MDLDEKLNDELANWFKDRNLSMYLRAEFDLESYIEGGIVSKNDIEEGYYLGNCRNTVVAYWNPELDKFEHTRTKFGSTYVEIIPHMEEKDYIYDVFIPIRKLDINEVENINKIELWKK